MPVPEYLGWGLLIPAAFSLLYGFSSHYAMRSLGYAPKDTVLARLRISLPVMILFVIWGMVNIPLTVVYLLAFLEKLFRLSRREEKSLKQLFVISLTHLMTMAFHMILIGILSFVIAAPPYEILKNPAWRIATIGTVLAVDNLAAFLLPRWKILFEVLRTQMDREEVRPFMVFLGFCNIFLLLDSVLCVARIDWKLMPLFLIGSAVLMEYYLLRFLQHLYTILKVQYLEREHQRLKAELELEYETAEKLRSKSDRDALTGVFSRRYVMEQLRVYLRKKEPFALAYIDLDRLKQINDREGHHAGDLYLIQFTRKLGEDLRESDIFARIGGDEFIVLFPGCTQEEAGKRMADSRAVMAAQNSPPLPFSFGVTYVSGDLSVTAEQVLHRADQVMYQDKKARIREGESAWL